MPKSNLILAGSRSAVHGWNTAGRTRNRSEGMILLRRKDREITDKNEIYEIIKQADVCRLAFTDGTTPYIVALNFGFDYNEKPTLYFHCAKEGKKLDFLKKNNLVCFQVDIDHELITGENGCDWGMKYRSVVGMGRAEIIDDRGERNKALNSIMKHYAGGEDFQYDEKVLNATVVFRVVLTELTGKKKI